MRTIGVAAAERVAMGIVEGNRLVSDIRRYQPAPEMPAEAYAERLKREIGAVGGEITAIGVGVPGIIRDGLIEESPNLQQLKGLNLGADDYRLKTVDNRKRVDLVKALEEYFTKSAGQR